MSSKSILKSFLPPILIKIIARIKNYIGLYEWRFVSYNWNPQFNDVGKGWDVKSISDLQLKKWKDYKSIINSTQPLGINHEATIPYDNRNIIFHNLLMTFAYVSALAANDKNEINFLDWGGGIGHYGVMIKKILSDVKVNYYCYDLQTYVDTGTDLFDSTTVISSDRNKLLKPLHYDLVMASSSIWYEPDWKAILKELITASSSYIYITRMIFVKGSNSFVGIQRPSYMGYKTSYYFWVINEDELIAEANKCNAQLIREFLVHDESYIFKAPEQGKFKGFLFKKLI